MPKLIGLSTNGPFCQCKSSYRKVGVLLGVGGGGVLVDLKGASGPVTLEYGIRKLMFSGRLLEERCLLEERRLLEEGCLLERGAYLIS